MSLRKATYSATRWTALSTTIRAALQIVQVVILARILIPADFGVMALATTIYSIMSMFVDFGISSALIHFPKPGKSVLSSLFWLNLGAAFGMMFLISALAFPLAWIYDAPDLTLLMILMSIALPISACGQQIRVMAEKELRFSKLAPIEITASIIGFLAAIYTASSGGGVYSFASSMLVTTTSSSVLFWLTLSNGLRPSLDFCFEEITAYLRYGAYRLGDMALAAIQSQTDVLVGSAFFGATNMGIYTVPREQALRIANSLINPVITRVGLPVMAAIQEDLHKVRTAYWKTLRMSSSTNFPVYAALAMWSDELIALVLGDDWGDAAVFMRIFAIWGLVRSIGNPLGSLLYATGHVRRAFWWNLSLSLLFPLPLIGAAYVGGLHGLAWTMLCLHTVILYPAYRYLIYPACKLPFTEFIGSLIPATISTLLTCFAALWFGQLSLTDTAFDTLLNLLFAVFMYLVFSWFLNKEWVHSMAELCGVRRH